MYSVSRSEFSNSPRSGKWDILEDGTKVAEVRFVQAEDDNPQRIDWAFLANDESLEGVIRVEDWIPSAIGKALSVVLHTAGIEGEIAWGAYEPNRQQVRGPDRHRRSEMLGGLTDSDDETLQREVLQGLHALDELVQDGRNRVAKLMKYQQDAKEALGYIGAPALARGYQDAANRARRSAFWWHVLAVLGFLGLIGFAVVVFSAAGPSTETAVPETVAWMGIARRVFFSTAILLFTGYAGKQASNSRKDELQFRRTELELIALGPFLADLPDDKRTSVKQKLAQRFFGEESTSEVVETGSQSTHPMDLLKELINKLPDHGSGA
ncbi:DUF805 domain-containing protein [Persicimonas caeni]|uniref:DUF805 domain-containing protein n=1 Tax=Persicimonas caeni TaxID=2292766 RepID=A0A4Y6PNB9_PERCE|nr:DUF805 domain-containing protein [Persicimonas caeni]QDG49517.1 DUF805 domain-containing protein [Persicimonas caeni]QED30738.1 DUF805 domain-containing protein [Persicimonas caeni]